MTSAVPRAECEAGSGRSTRVPINQCMESPAGKMASVEQARCLPKTNDRGLRQGTSARCQQTERMGKLRIESGSRRDRMCHEAWNKSLDSQKQSSQRGSDSPQAVEARISIYKVETASRERPCSGLCLPQKHREEWKQGLGYNSAAMHLPGKHKVLSSITSTTTTTLKK